ASSRIFFPGGCSAGLLRVPFPTEIDAMTHWSAIVSASALCVVTTSVVVQGKGGGGNPEAQARQRQQQELEASTPKLQITEEVLALSVSGHPIGDIVGGGRTPA